MIIAGSDPLGHDRLYRQSAYSTTHAYTKLRLLAVARRSGRLYAMPQIARTNKGAATIHSCE